MPASRSRPDHRVDERRLGRDLHPFDRVDERGEVVHVKQDVAIDLRLVQRLHRSDQRFHPLLGVEAVDLAGVRRPVGERHVDRVARKRNEAQLRLVGREADEHQRIGVDRLIGRLTVRIAVGADVQDRPTAIQQSAESVGEGSRGRLDRRAGAGGRLFRGA